MTLDLPTKAVILSASEESPGEAGPRQRTCGTITSADFVVECFAQGFFPAVRMTTNT